MHIIHNKNCRKLGLHSKKLECLFCVESINLCKNGFKMQKNVDISILKQWKIIEKSVSKF